MTVLGMLPLTIFLGLASLAAVSLLLERSLSLFYSEKNRPDSLFHKKSTIKFFMEMAHMA